MSIPKIPLAAVLLVTLTCACLLRTRATAVHADPSGNGVSVITVGPQILHTGVQHFGINLSGQSFYDSGQMLRNQVERNPGFEGEIWQSILRCKKVTATTCTEDNQYTQWPAAFLNGAHFEVISGAADGESGTVLNSSTASSPDGITLEFAPLHTAVAPGDFVVVHMDKPGDATAGWWTDVKGGAGFATERKDLAPESPGRQAVRVDALAQGASAVLTSYFDSTEGHSFVQLRGDSLLSFRAKPLAGASRINVSLARLDTRRGRQEYLNKDFALAPGWHEYSVRVHTGEDGGALGTVGLAFAVSEATVLLDDISLTSVPEAGQQTGAFRPEVVGALRALRPGLLRYMDSGASFGSSLDNLLLPEFARQRAGYSTQETRREDIPIGLADFLSLCEQIGADPWISLPAGTSPDEAASFIDFLGGAVSTAYGRRRALLGHSVPWTHVFHTIHLELGDEEWNAPSFAGAAIAEPTVYAHRAGKVFGAMRAMPSFQSGHYDLIAGTWNAVPWWTAQELASAQNIDTVAIAPYLFTEFNDASSPEAIFGPMLAQPEQMDGRAEGGVAKQAAEVRSSARPVHLAVYETNLGTMSGSATQTEIDSTVPSWAGGLAVADHMLLMLRDEGITTQALFCLPEYKNLFTDTAGRGRETMPLWGAVVDMGGETDRLRPTYLALQQINKAVLSTMLQTTVTETDPTWNQPLSRNDKIELRGAHELQTFAFADGVHRSLIVLNLSRTQSHKVQLAAGDMPSGFVEQTTLASQHLSDSNELAETVRPKTVKLPSARLQTPFSLLPGSMTVLRWDVSPASPR